MLLTAYTHDLSTAARVVQAQSCLALLGPLFLVANIVWFLICHQSRTCYFLTSAAIFAYGFAGAYDIVATHPAHLPLSLDNISPSLPCLTTAPRYIPIAPDYAVPWRCAEVWMFAVLLVSAPLVLAPWLLAKAAKAVLRFAGSVARGQQGQQPFLDGGNNPVPDHTVDEDRRQGEFEKLRRDETRASQAELRAERKGDDEKKDVKEPKHELGLAKGQIGFYQEQNEEVESLDTHTSTEGSGKVEIAELIKKLENKQKLIAQISQRAVDDKKKMTELLYQLNRLKETATPMQKANWESHSKSQEALLVEMAELKKKDRDKQVLIGKIAQKAVDDEKKIADRNKSIQKCKEEVTHLQKEVSDLTHERDELKRQLSTHLPGTEAWTQFARKEL